LTILVDTNVLIDIVGRDREWLAPSLAGFLSALALGPVVVNEVVYAELCAGYASREAVDGALGQLGIDLVRIEPDALFLAGKAFKRYRESGGTRTGVLPDFFIGAHAQVESLQLLTRDPRRYRTYFPSVELIVPAA